MPTPFPELETDDDFYWSDYENNEQKKSEREVWNQGIRYLVKLARALDSGIITIGLNDHELNWLETDDGKRLEAARRINLT